MVSRFFHCVALIALVTSVEQAFAQQEGLISSGEAGVIPNVYVDCSRCDIGFLRQEVQFVNYVRDQELSDIYIFVTTEQTGGGGQTYTLTFTGQQTFTGIDHVLTYTSRQTNTFEEERDAVNETIKLGLVPYLIRTPLAGQISVAVDGSESVEAEAVDDPWDSWVFDVDGGGSFNLEESQKSYSLRGSVNAARVTEDWKIISRLYGNHDYRDFENDGEQVTSISRQGGLQNRAIKSLTKRWSAGVFSDIESNTYRNIDWEVSLAPALEYNLYPYSESSRREWVIIYRVEGAYREYLKETVFLKTEEMLFQHSLGTWVNIRQPWGFVYLGLSGSHYFHDISKNSIEFSNNLSLRLTRGLSLRFWGGFEIIHDQLYLPAGDVPLEEVLLQQRQLATAYELSGSVGLSYTFGSAYNNVVNTRL